jgi:hypothetical protein
MISLNNKTDIRVKNVNFTDDLLIVELMDGRIISAPMAWYPRLFNASVEERKNWTISAGGYGIHWQSIDEDLSSEGLLLGAKSPEMIELV